MKTRILLTLALAAVALVAAEAPVATETLKRIQCDLETNTVQAYFEKKITVDGQTFVQPWVGVGWTLGSDKTVTVGDKTYTYAEVMAAVVAIANQERNAPPPAPAPEPTPAPQP
jgi:hypothetical protein